LGQKQGFFKLKKFIKIIGKFLDKILTQGDQMRIAGFFENSTWGAAHICSVVVRFIKLILDPIVEIDAPL
jgi:hypothetical protein